MSAQAIPARRPRKHHANFVDALTGQVQCVEKRGAGDDGGAVLVVVEHRDLQLAAQALLDVETLRRLDVFEVDASERRLERFDDPDDLLGIRRVQLKIEHVDVGKPLEERRLSLHHRLGAERADVPQAEHCGAVAHDGDEVASARESVRQTSGSSAIARLARATPGV